MKNTFTLILIFYSSILLSQSGRITGLVMDGEYDEPMAFANVIVKGSTIGTTTDFDGKYSLDLQPGEYTLTFSFVGYQTIEVSEVLIKSDEVEQVDVTLSTNTLDEIIITTTVMLQKDVARTSSCQFVPTPKSEIFGKIIPSPAFTLASLRIAAYSLAFTFRKS